MKRFLQGLVVLLIIIAAAMGVRLLNKSMGWFGEFTEAGAADYVGDSGLRAVMGTWGHIIAVDADQVKADKAIEAAWAEVVRIDEMMSDYKEDSLLSQVNNDAFAGAVEVSAELFDVLLAAIEYSKLSDGAFDVTVGPVVDLWKKAGDDKRKPIDAELAEARAKVGYQKLILDKEKLTVRFAVEGMRIDLGAIAKGYAIDRAVEILVRQGIGGGMVDLGGDLKCFGTAPKGRASWRIGLQDPRDEAEILLKLKLADIAVATSGDYRRFVLIEGEHYSHIVDPATSSGAKGLSSVTIIAPTAMAADALATTVSVMGSEKGIELIESIEAVEAIVIPSDKPDEFAQTSGVEKYILE